jgi:UDP-N-acetylmuramoyl-tripeptide--D-alanyl-D-alanine ligase
VKYRISDIPEMLRSPLGRMHIVQGFKYRAWPALALLADAYRRSLLKRTRIAAVVGSFGKSTTTRALDAAFGNDPVKTSPRNAWSNLALSVLRLDRMARRAAIEAGIDGFGQMKKYAAMIRPDIAVVTTIGSEHNRSLKTIEATREEKADMVRALPANGLAVLNNDDTNVMWMKDKTRARVVTYGLGEDSDVRAVDIRLDWPHGTRFTLHAGGMSYDVKTRLVGRHMVYPVLAAFAAAAYEGVEPETILARLAALLPTPGRCEPVMLENGAIILRDEYKSAYETIDAALDVFSELPAKRRMAVLGDITEPVGRQRQLYRDIGARVAPLVSLLVLLCSQTESVRSAAKKAGLDKERIIDMKNDIPAAAEFLKKELRPGDVVLLKGRLNQRFDRIALALVGRDVRCDIKMCDTRAVLCSGCPMLERGWQGLRVIT